MLRTQILFPRRKKMFYLLKKVKRKKNILAFRTQILLPKQIYVLTFQLLPSDASHKRFFPSSALQFACEAMFSSLAT